MPLSASIHICGNSNGSSPDRTGKLGAKSTQIRSFFSRDYTKEEDLLAQLLVPKFKMSLDQLFCPAYSTPEPCAYLQLDLLHSFPVQLAHKTGEATSRPSKTVEERMESSHCEH